MANDDATADHGLNADTLARAHEILSTEPWAPEDDPLGRVGQQIAHDVFRVRAQLEELTRPPCPTRVAASLRANYQRCLELIQEGAALVADGGARRGDPRIVTVEQGLVGRHALMMKALTAAILARGPGRSS